MLSNHCCADKFRPPSNNVDSDSSPLLWLIQMLTNNAGDTSNNVACNKYQACRPPRRLLTGDATPMLTAFYGKRGVIPTTSNLLSCSLPVVVDKHSYHHQYHSKIVAMRTNVAESPDRCWVDVSGACWMMLHTCWSIMWLTSTYQHWPIRRFPAEFPMTNGGRHWD